MPWTVATQVVLAPPVSVPPGQEMATLVTVLLLAAVLIVMVFDAVCPFTKEYGDRT